MRRSGSNGYAAAPGSIGRYVVAGARRLAAGLEEGVRVISEARAEQMLQIRNESFMQADIEAYMSLWNDDGVIEMGDKRFAGGAAIRQAIVAEWSSSRVLHFETRSFAIRGRLLLNEFAIVWQDRKTGAITLQTGMGVLEVAENGRFCALRDYMEAADGMRSSALAIPAVGKHFTSGR